jgi:hypothetical protein
MSTENSKCGLAEHKMHIRSLHAADNTAEIARLSDNPSVECGVCGAKANCVVNVCTPAKVFEDEQVA